MTREEAIKRLKCWLSNGTEGMTSDRAGYIEGWFVNADVKAFQMAIQALEQEPCENAISRQAVLEYIEGSEAELGHSSENELVCQDIKELPPVTSKPKMGRWIDEGFYAEGHSEHAYRCSECDEHYIGYVGEFKHCPNCGAKMQEVEE